MFRPSFWLPGGLRVVGVLSLVLARPVVVQGFEGEARAYLEKLGAARGLCVVLGDPQGSLSLELARDSELTLFAQSPQPTEVAAARQAADAAGLLGTRIYVQQGDYTHLNLANDLADAVIVANSALVVPRDELMRVLRPDGKAIVGQMVFTKPYAPDTDEWTHP
ncbi:MAG: class I SAM-dependent methyltransferase, partial [Pirellulales bacterium]